MAWPSNPFSMATETWAQFLAKESNRYRKILCIDSPRVDDPGFEASEDQQDVAMGQMSSNTWDSFIEANYDKIRQLFTGSFVFASGFELDPGSGPMVLGPYTLPATDGDPGWVLTTDSEGNLTWSPNDSVVDGSAEDSTLRWSGTAWVENTAVLATSDGDVRAARYLTTQGGTVGNSLGIAALGTGAAVANVAYATALGRRAKANHQGALVLSDSQDADQASSAADRFHARFSGGYKLLGTSGTELASIVTGQVDLLGIHTFTDTGVYALGASLGSTVAEIRLRKTDAGNADIVWQNNQSGTMRTRNRARLDTAEDWTLTAHDTAGAVAFTTTYTNSTGAWTMPADVTLSSASPSLVLGNTGGAPLLRLTGAVASDTQIRFQAGGTTRWDVRQAATSGDFLLRRYVSGTGTDNPLSVSNATGNITVANALAVGGAATLGTSAVGNNHNLIGSGTIFTSRTDDAQDKSHVLFCQPRTTSQGVWRWVQLAATAANNTLTLGGSTGGDSATLVQFYTATALDTAGTLAGSIDSTQLWTIEKNLQVNGQFHSPDHEQASSGTAVTINWNNGNTQVLDLNDYSGDVTVTLSNGRAGAVYKLIVVQTNAGATRNISTWTTTPFGLAWADNDGAPVITATNGAIDILTFVVGTSAAIQAERSGSMYFGSKQQDYA